ncbi:MAG: T9SS type A sorting domain-containing protein, partial [Gammaproteobacteria bacterium]|nr:T9SS type A sorting domain-containing protein [Gammaproteobacteria bacterium]NIW43658.1 T9SS type A sorting domain-containing protein [Gammaproteobacteria bacterium]NIX54782.1 T9SS type A sorting domain-containing protein [candidate division Zixibacteria bacterium]
NTVWQATYPRPNAAEGTNDLVIDREGNIYITGTIGLSTFESDYLAVKFSQEPLSVDENEAAPKYDFSLFQNYPNPFNSSTTIPFSIGTSAHVRLKIFNILGQEIVTLVNKVLDSGNYEVTWEAANVASGIYWYQLQSDGFTESKKLLLIR